MKGWLSIATASILLSGCATTKEVPRVPEKPRLPPPDAVQECPSLADVDLGQGSLSDLAMALQRTADRYQECKSRHGELVDWVKKSPR